jgi:hypothetical protein
MHVNTRVTIGDRFGSVVVLDRTRRGRSNALVRCDCGREFNAYTYLLESGQTKHCQECANLARRGKPNIANRIDPVQRTVNDLWNSFRKAMRAKAGSTLTKDEWLAVVTSACVYCGRERVNCRKALVDHAEDFWYNGVDRIDSSLPYVSGNVQPACWVCNRMKGNMSHEDFLAHVRLVAAE